MNNRITIQQTTCINCGGNLIFDNERKNAKCEFCGCTYVVVEDKTNLFDVKFNPSGKLDSINLNIHGITEPVFDFFSKAGNGIMNTIDKKKQDEKIESEKRKQESDKVLIYCGIFFAVMMLILFFLGRSEKKDNDGKIPMPQSYTDFQGDNYKDVEKVLKKAGFTNVQTEPMDDLIVGFLYKEGDVAEIVLDGDNSTFSSGAYYYPTTDIVIRYHSYPESTASDNTVNDDNSNVIETESDSEEVILTAENNADTKKLLSKDGDDLKFERKYAAKYAGRKIEFDGNVTVLTHHGNYKTRYDLLISIGDYNEDSMPGPSFRFTDVNFSQLHIEDGVDTIKESDNIHVVAEIVEFDYNHGIFELKPVSIRMR